MMEAISFDARHLSDSDWNNNRQLLGWSRQTPGQLTCLFVWLVVWPHALERSAIDVNVPLTTRLAISHNLPTIRSTDGSD